MTSESADIFQAVSTFQWPNIPILTWTANATGPSYILPMTIQEAATVTQGHAQMFAGKLSLFQHNWSLITSDPWVLQVAFSSRSCADPESKNQTFWAQKTGIDNLIEKGALPLVSSPLQTRVSIPCCLQYQRKKARKYVFLQVQHRVARMGSLHQLILK